jgi:hypothetical protein
MNKIEFEIKFNKLVEERKSRLPLPETIKTSYIACVLNCEELYPLNIDNSEILNNNIYQLIQFKKGTKNNKLVWERIL